MCSKMNKHTLFLITIFRHVLNVVFFHVWVIIQYLNFMFQCFGTLCSNVIGCVRRKNPTCSHDRIRWNKQCYGTSQGDPGMWEGGSYTGNFNR